MSYRRSGVNYILWALYGLTVCAALTMQAETVCMLLGWAEVQWYLLAAAGCILLLFFLLFLPVRLLSGRYGSSGKKERGREGRPGKKLAEGGYLVLLIAVSLGLRLFCMREMTAAEMGDAGMVLTSGFPFASLTLSSLYAWLKLLLSAWTERGIYAAGFLAPLYETLGVLLFYPALRSLAGKLSAVTVTAVLAFLPVFPGMSEAGGRYGFFLTAAAILLLLSSFYIESLSAGKLSAKKPAAKKSVAGLAVLCGLPTGAAVFLDTAFVSLLLFSIWTSFFVLPVEAVPQSGSRARRDGTAVKGRRTVSGQAGNGKRRAVGIIALILAAVLGYAALLAVQVWLSGEGPLETLMGRYSPVGIVSGSAGESMFWLIPVVCLCILYIFGFFDQRGNVGSVWLPSFLFSVAVSASGGKGGAEQAMSLLYWLIMAGMGLHSAFFREGKRKERGDESEEIPVPTEAVYAVKEGMEKNTAAGRDPMPGEPLPNPLPVPKRHERREMDYAYEPGEDEMFFDIDRVEEGDDFDYQ